MRCAAPVALIVLAALTLPGCSRDITVANLSSGPITAAVSVADEQGVVYSASGVVLPPSQTATFTVQPGGQSRLSIWKGALEQGPPAAAVPIAASSTSLTVRSVASGAIIVESAPAP